jgi:hypothetical protein
MRHDTRLLMALDGTQGDGITLDPNGIPLAFFLPLGYWTARGSTPRPRKLS